LEFTQTAEPAHHTFDDDDILVFYPETKEVFNTIVQNIKQNNIEFITPKNPYWQQNGIAIKDPDNYTVVIVNVV
jgi:tRNA(Leu) C34 or U34 (ribose-2'-O)-methylase TrmL